MNKPIKILHVTAADITVEKLLLPLINRLTNSGYEVHVACSNGRYVPELRERGYIVHTIAIDRRIKLISNLTALWLLYQLMRKERFDIVHVHTPIAAVLGRIAAWIARVPIIIYTVHGFYFHEYTKKWLRNLMVFLERILCLITDLIFTQSHEDAVTAVKESICPEDKVLWIGNGVDISRFSTNNGSNGIKKLLGLCGEDRIIGFVGRLVREKGILELIQAMELVVKVIPDAKLLLVGDTLDSDRDKLCKQIIMRHLNKHELTSHVIFTGFAEDVTKLMSVMELFVLPSYREGMPRTIIEAMACGIPVVATNIRGCREEVVPGVTGLLVPINDYSALASAIISILSDSDQAHQMGNEARKRACNLFDENNALDKQEKAYSEVINKRMLFKYNMPTKKQVQLWLKQAIDSLISIISLTILSIPFLVIMIAIKVDSRGTVLFRQERAGRQGKSFRIWKFRTMVENAVNQGLGFNVAKDDSRITRVGKFLRNWGLDELLQLVNVLLGEMSIVGPRPALPYQAELYNNHQRQRLLVKPGITSLAVIKGRNLLSWNERIELDIQYIHSWSLWLDLKIIIKTFWAVLVSRRGIYGPEGINDDFVCTADSNSEKDNSGKKLEAVGHES